MTNTFRRRDLKIPVRDGGCWRGCGDSYCIWCSTTRQNKKIKEGIRSKEIIDASIIC